MKTVLALVDFSDASNNALSFAAELSKRTSARLVIVNIIQKGDEEEETKNKLKSIESDLKKSFDSNLNCESSIAHRPSCRLARREKTPSPRESCMNDGWHCSAAHSQRR